MAIGGGDGSIVLTTKVDETGIKKGIGSMGKTAKAFGAAVAKSFAVIGAAAATATVAITKMAVSAYADYEQLVGGVETLFKGSAKRVMAYAENAFYTAGVSANEYMKQVTSFSAALIRSTAGDTDKAADIANMALQDISDNVNKMGSSMESVQLAYQGFARQQYLLLDNLKLGYGGTKTEMERLLKDAQALTGVKYDINNLADVYSAIHAIQEELGITGTTAKEAEKTIQGSANMMKAAWQNVLSAIAGGGSIDRAMKNFTTAFKTYIDNLEPVIESAMDGLGQAITTLAPVIIREFAEALIKLIPTLITVIYEMIVGLAQGIWEGITSLFSSKKRDLFGAEVESIDESTKSQNKLTKALEETANAQKGVLAGFDEINLLNSKTADESSDELLNFDVGSTSNAVDSIESVKDTTAEAKKELSGLSKMWNDFVTQVESKIDTTEVYELDNAWLKLKNSSVDLYKTIAEKFPAFNLDFAQMYAELVNRFVSQTAGLMTSGSGILDFMSSVLDADAEGMWQAVGRISGGAAQIMGVADDMFDSITADVHNIYSGLSTETINELQSFQDLYAQVNGLINNIMFDFQDALISDKEVSSIESALDVLFDDISEKSEANHKEASQYLQSLVNQGLMSEADAKKGIAKLDKVYNDRENLLKKNQNDIINILKTANSEERALTESERQKIQEIMTQSNNEVTSTIAAGADDRTLIMEKLNENEEALTAVRLSQIIQFANSEYEQQVKSADAKYKKAITEADKLYYELGIIDEEEYNRVKKAAEDTRKAEVKEAKKSKEDLIKLAQEKAGGVADAVDPKSGEILSRWERTWNSMYETVRRYINKIIDGINSMIHGWFSISDSISGIFGAQPVADIIKIPKLAQGAVIPPNREFMSILGDNKREPEIVSPLSTMKQAVIEAMATVNSNSGSFNGRIEVPVIIDGREVARAVREAEGNMGSQTVFGGFANVY